VGLQSGGIHILLAPQSTQHPSYLPDEGDSQAELPADGGTRSECLYTAQDCQSAWQCMTFSRDGTVLAAGGHERVILLYATSPLRLLRRLKGHSSTITALDFSMDGAILQSTSQSHELLYHQVASGGAITSTEGLRDVEWFSWTCIHGWPTQGIWPPNSKPADINSVTRSHDHRLLAVTDDFRTVRLFNYPCTKRKAPHHRLLGHSSFVMRACWSADDNFLLSVGGGTDAALLQWSRTRCNCRNCISVARWIEQRSDSASGAASPGLDTGSDTPSGVASPGLDTGSDTTLTTAQKGTALRVSKSAMATAAKERNWDGRHTMLEERPTTVTGKDSHRKLQYTGPNV